MTGPGGRNRLAGEKSPYLLQHADNPVDWHPWGEKAFDEARRTDRPVFLSIGYSSCHWCHVMERESFEDRQVARLLNEHFVPVKVDREERPDIDNVYMKVCQAMTGSGGWPLTVVMTPDGKPFFAGTYFPKSTRMNLPGLLDLLPHISSLWKDDRERLLEIGIGAVTALEGFARRGETTRLSADILRAGFESLAASYDEVHGGFGTAPKFPGPHQLSFLLRWHHRSGEPRVLEMVERTLRSIFRGGINDHLEGGFHRYSTDGRWLVPHFEKMLYDQALLAIAFTEAFEVTGDPFYSKAAAGVFDYVLERMTSPEGGFYSSEDADSEGEEGKFYAWDRDTILEELGEKDGALFCSFYGITGERHFEGGAVLHIASTVEEAAGRAGLEAAEVEGILERGRSVLRETRSRRARPFLDDKVLADWNGLMIAALAKGAVATGKSEYLEAASRAADFILDSMRREDGRLLHRFREGEAAIPGYLDDYAFLAWGLTELYRADFEVRRLESAIELAEGMRSLFADSGGGGFFFTGSDSEPLVARPKEGYDGAVPSGNSVAALVLLTLGRMTGDGGMETAAVGLLEEFSPLMSSAPPGAAQMMIALDLLLGPVREVVIAGRRGAPETEAMLSELRGRFLPRTVTAFRPTGEGAGESLRILPMLEGMDREGAAYVCENFTCRAPVSSPEELAGALEIDGGEGG